MLRRSFKPAKCKTSLKLATSRMKLLRNKKDAQLKQLKREVSQLLESGKERTARIRVEHVTREENTIAAYDLLEIYCELIVARLPVIESQKNCPLDLKEAIASIIFASPRCADIPEFVDVKKHFTAKYGKEFVTAATELRPDSGVSRMLIEKLSIKAPDGQAKLKILSAIAEEFNIKWDPESSGENESKPPEDLMNGPTTFTEASEVHRSSAVQSPPSNVHPPSNGVQKQYAPVDRNHMSPTHVKNDSFTSFGDQPTEAVSSGPGFLPSGTGSRKDVRHPHSGDRRNSSMGRQNWHMEFKDATAAAHAAAESAERASMAARAAAEIASREKITSRQYSREPRRSNTNSFKDEESRENVESRLPTMDSPKTYNSGSGSSNVHTEQTHFNHRNNLDTAAHTSYREGLETSDSLRSRTASVSDNKQLNDFHVLETSDEETVYSGKSTRQHSNGSSAEFVVDQKPHSQYEETDYSGEERIRKQPSNVFSDPLPSDQGYDHGVPHSSFQKFGADSFENPFVSDDQGFTKPENSNDNAAVVFDESGSDEDIISFDTQPDYDIKPSKLFSPSRGRESSSHSSVSADTWSPRKSVTTSRQESSSHSSVFNHTAEKISPRKFDENATRPPHPSQPNDVFSATFDDSESEDELEEEKPQHSRRDSRFLPVDDLKDEENRKPSSRDTLKDEMSFHQSNSESEFNFGTLSGGLRNKGYRPVSHARSAPTALLSSTENKGDSIDDSGVGSSLKPGRASPRVKDRWNSATPVAPNELDTDDSEEELSHNSHGKQKLQNAKESKEVHARSRIKAPAPNTILDPNEGDSEKDLPRNSPSGLSRRTKGAPSPRKASYSPSPDLKSPVSNEADPVKKVSKSHYESNTLPKRESSSVSLNWQKSADWRASKQTTSKPFADSNNSTRTEYLKSSTMERPSRPLKKVPLASYESPKSSVVTQEGLSRESSSSKSSLKKVASTSAGSPNSSTPPSRESSFGKAGHVHPKLPDYDTIAAMLQSRRTN